MIIKNSTFDNNRADNVCYENGSCNQHGSVCLFSNLEYNDGSTLEYSIKNVTFINNVGCSNGEAFTIHLGNGATNGNCYAENGMRCYTNGHYPTIPCYTQHCNARNNQTPLLDATCPTH